MADVARLAGVSHQTVSRVLNSHPNVKPQTRDSVLAAIAELGYRPNAAARTLVTRRTHTLGVPEDEIARVHRPIGLNIGSRTPAEIALATIAGLIADRNGRPGGFEF